MAARITIDLEELIQLKADARGFSFLPRQPVSSLLAGRHSSRLRGRGLSFEELRRYQQGDDIRTIDWRATARYGTPHVRVYNEERERPVLAIVDQRFPMFFGSRQTMKSVIAAEVAALTAWRTLDVGDRIGGIIFNEADIVEIRPQRNQSQALGMLQEIVKKNHQLASDSPAKGKVTLNDALAGAHRIAKHDHLLIVITDLDGVDDETQRLLTEIAAHNDVIVVAVYDPLGASLQGKPDMRATDRGKQWQIPTGKNFSTAFQDTFSALLNEWLDVTRALKVPVVPISTREPAAAQINELFGPQANPQGNS